MVPCRFTVAPLALLAAFAATAVAAEPANREDPVRIYTNADLEELDPLPVAAQADGQTDESGWESVAEFIAREHRRLDAERSYELNRRLVEIEEEQAADRRDRPGIGFASYRGYPVVYAYPYAPGVGKRAGRASWTATSGLGGRIVPLHARPTPTQVQRSKAIQRSGRDAFPN
jgi:hypothetical protein